MKLFEIKNNLPIGIYCYNIEHNMTLNPEDILEFWAFSAAVNEFDKIRRLVLYGRNWKHLEEFTKIEYVSGDYKFITPDKCVIKCSNIEYKWVNHTGNLKDWFTVKEYYELY
jgi:hypothetical protein